MKYNELVLKRQKKTPRVGRGISAGQGKTAGRGTKGQGSRKSGNVRAGFEGGQMPLYMRLPHLRGFKSKRTQPETIYTSQLSLVKKTVIGNEALYEAGLISSPNVKVKLITRGEITGKYDVKLQGASTSAQEALKKAGGSFTVVGRQARESKKTKAE